LQILAVLGKIVRPLTISAEEALDGFAVPPCGDRP
jgi:hypothetical protein